MYLSKIKNCNKCMNLGLSKQLKCINKCINKCIDKHFNFDYFILFFILKLISKKKKYEILCINIDLHIA